MRLDYSGILVTQIKGGKYSNVVGLQWNIGDTNKGWEVMWLDQWNIGNTNKGWEVMWLGQWNIGDTNKGWEVMWLDYTVVEYWRYK